MMREFLTRGRVLRFATFATLPFQKKSQVERKGVACGFGRAAEELTHQDGCVDFHLCGDLAAQEGREDEVQLPGFTEALDSRGAISVTERVGVIARVRKLAVGVAQAWVEQQEGKAA